MWFRDYGNRGITLLLLVTIWIIPHFTSATSKPAGKSTPQQRETIFQHRSPTRMTIEEAMQYERRLEDRADFSSTAEADRSFVSPSAKAVPGEIKNYPIPPGAIYCGETTWDLQYAGSPQRSIEHCLGYNALDGVRRYVHVTWTVLKTYDVGDSDRSVHQDWYDWTIAEWGERLNGYRDLWGGLPIIEVGERGGFAHVAINSEGNAINIHHSATEGGPNYSRVVRYSIPGYGIYTADRLTNLPGQENIWLRGAIGHDELTRATQEVYDIYHIGAHDSNPGSSDPADQCYWRYIALPSPGYWEGPVPMGQTMTVPSHVLAADGERVVFMWSQSRNYGEDRDNYDNDLGYWESTNAGADWIANGGFTQTDWDAGEGYNVTDYADADPHRVYNDISVMFDFDGRLHAIFTTPGYDDATGEVSVGPTVMYHWDEETPGSNENAVISGGTPGGFVGGQDIYHHIAAAALWGADDPDEANDGSSGAWNRYIAKMTLGIGDGSTACFDPDNNNSNYGYLYAFYTLFGGQAVEDKEDASASGYQNGNIYISMSQDNGFSWDAGRCYTTDDGTFGGTPTRSPNCDCP
ncbi:hypothetical protein ACFLQW_01080, partial [Candidatus Zixiibacteriota bacterium]